LRLPSDGEGVEATRRASTQVAHLRAGKGFARRALVADASEVLAPPAPPVELSQVRDGVPPGALLGSGAPPSASAIRSLAGGTGRDPAPNESARAHGSARQARHELVRVQPTEPFVELVDDTGATHRLALDRNQHLHYFFPPDATDVPVDMQQRVLAFNFALDLNHDVHVAWFALETGQLYYARLVWVGDTFALDYEGVLAKPEEPAQIVLSLSEEFVTVRFGVSEPLEYVRVGVADPSVRVHGTP